MPPIKILAQNWTSGHVLPMASFLHTADLKSLLLAVIDLLLYVCGENEVGVPLFL